MLQLIKEPTNRTLTPYLFKDGTYRSHAILAPNITIARESNKRYGGKYVGIDNRPPKIQQDTVGITVRESNGELRARTMINLGDYPIPEETPDPVIRAFIEKVGRWTLDRQDTLIGNTQAINSILTQIKKEI